MLQIIIIQLSFLIWLTSALHKREPVQVIGLVSALILAAIGFAQAAQVRSILP
jgi:hypothetical protein